MSCAVILTLAPDFPNAGGERRRPGHGAYSRFAAFIQRALAASDGEPEAVRQTVRACREPETAADWVRTGCHLVDAG